MSKQYIGSQEHWEDEINADYDKREQEAKQQEKDALDEQQPTPAPQMLSKDEDRLIALRVLNKHFKDVSNLELLEDGQVKYILNAMQEYTSQYTKQDAVEFLEWVAGNNYHQMNGCITFRQAEAEVTDYYTPQELYTIFKKQIK